ncbi:ElaB/YqjD/DUF883 family membrane-anchored ribosome-binding protein [Sphaerotilus hippei]|uniref:ElaB/YqjD/DUF883 family membrane-anchored ribosome-binding protein n=1 Tax=Sphaerotilus hippei TaxID=744406 RepID=A0A318H6C5_9BURK|nr:YqjD family protein [Sphaerotilus hippei]PXW99537.1 ElaB/YqjD/DUF883 family membrane-anchored ribosome-binding protein [Sphaerotilus hippei]
MSEFNAAQKDRLLSELRMVVADAEDLLKVTADDASDEMSALRSRVQSRLKDAKAQIVQIQEAALARAKEASKATDAYVHENPWKSIGVAAGVGLLVGMLIGRR